MIIQCESCSKKFIVKDSDIPEEGRMVQCGYCSVTWHQMPVSIPTKILKKTDGKKSTNIRGIPKLTVRVSRVVVSASDGSISELAGTSRTSSNVSASRISTIPTSWIRCKRLATHHTYAVTNSKPHKRMSSYHF